MVCPGLKDRLEIEVKFLSELTQSYQELNEKFEQSVQDDFTAQTEGFIDGVRHNEAVKLSFARKKLSRNLDIKKEQLKELRGLYCVNCTEKGSIDRNERCLRCPDDKMCMER